MHQNPCFGKNCLFCSKKMLLTVWYLVYIPYLGIMFQIKESWSKSGKLGRYLDQVFGYLLNQSLNQPVRATARRSVRFRLIGRLIGRQIGRLIGRLVNAV